MWTVINSFIKKEKTHITTGLICKLYLNKDKSKSINIQIYENTTVKDLYDNFKIIIEGNIGIIDNDTQEYKFILKDKTNNNNKFILKNNFLLFDYLMNENEKYELFYLPCNKRKPYAISMALKDKNSFQHTEIKEEAKLKPIKFQLIKQDTAFKFSKKMKQFVKINISLHTEHLEIEKIKSNKDSTIIPLSTICDIKEVYDKSYKQGFSTMLISSVYSSKTKNYYIAFNSDSFDVWFTVINNHFHQYMDMFSFIKICKDLNELNRKKNSLLIQLVNKFSNIKGVLSLKFSKKIFYDFYDNKNIKEIYDLILLYQNNITKKEYALGYENLNKIINILEKNKELNIECDKNKNAIDSLKQHAEKLNEKINNDNNIININEIQNDNMIKDDKDINNNKVNINNSIKNKNNVKKGEYQLNCGFIYNFIDNLIIKYFEPRFNEIMMNSKLKNEFLNKIMEFALKGQNKEDNEFYDINASVNELIIVNE